MCSICYLRWTSVWLVYVMETQRYFDGHSICYLRWTSVWLVYVTETQRYFDGYSICYLKWTSIWLVYVMETQDTLMVTQGTRLFTFESGAESYISLRRWPPRLKSSNSALVMQDGNGPSYDFLTKLLGVDNTLFIFNREYYFPFSSLLVHKSHKSTHWHCQQ
jgi:hypothetical protein